MFFIYFAGKKLLGFSGATLTLSDPGECMDHKLWVMAASPHPTRSGSAILAASSNSSQRVVTMPPRFQMHVLPWCKLILEWPQFVPQHVVHVLGTFRAGVKVQIIQKSFSCFQPLGHNNQCRMLSKTEQQGHEWVPLFPTLALHNVVNCFHVVPPQEH